MTVDHLQVVKLVGEGVSRQVTAQIEPYPIREASRIR